MEQVCFPERDFMKIKKITKIEPEMSRCIEVSHKDRLFAAGGDSGNAIVSHNSVVQRNIILGCILRPDSWRFLGIDLKKVELSSFRAYSNVVLGIGTELEDALTILRFGQQTMMKRYAEMEQLGVNNFLDLPEKGQALMIMVDEAGELLTTSGVKALVGNTILPTPEGNMFLEDVEIGDMVFDNYGNVAEVTNKYIPIEQSSYDMKIVSDTSGVSENFTAGAEHNWVAYFTSPDGETVGPEIVDTKFLHDFKAEQDKLPTGERTSVKFKRG